MKTKRRLQRPAECRIVEPHDWPPFRFSAAALRDLQQHLPVEAISDLEGACEGWLHTRIEDTESARFVIEDIERAAELARELAAIVAKAPAPNAWAIRSQMSDTTRFPGAVSDLNTGRRGQRALCQLLLELADGCERDLSRESRSMFKGLTVCNGGTLPPAGRPIGPDWWLMKGAAAVSLRNGITPSPASCPFMEIAATVWSEAGKTGQPVHAVRMLRRELRKHGPHIVTIERSRRAYWIKPEARGRFSVVVSEDAMALWLEAGKAAGLLDSLPPDN